VYAFDDYGAYDGDSNIMIREARQEDVKELVALGKLFYESTILPAFAGYDEITMESLLSTYIVNDTCAVFVMESDGKVVGGIIGHVAPAYWNVSVLSGQQLGWFVHPEYRSFHSIKLLDTLYQWAKSKGAKMFFSGAKLSKDFEGMDAMLRHKKYVPLEMAYIKEIA
jgi:hypothetical protein